MQPPLEQRLRQLKAEYEAGQKILAELEAKQDSLRETLARIREAIEALEEALRQTGAPTAGPLPVGRVDAAPLRPPEVNKETP